MTVAFEYFKDRRHAGVALSHSLDKYKSAPNTIVLALPRGGVPVAYEVANALRLPLDVLLVRKLGVPGRPEMAMGAIAIGGAVVMNDAVIADFKVSSVQVEETIAFEQLELHRRNNLYRAGCAPISVEEKTVIVVDDGAATGATMMSSLKTLREMQVKTVIAAYPVGAPSSFPKIQALADEVACLHMPEPFNGVSQWYDDFSQVSDQEVLRLLKKISSNNLRS